MTRTETNESSAGTTRVENDFWSNKGNITRILFLKIALITCAIIT